MKQTLLFSRTVAQLSLILLTFSGYSQTIGVPTVVSSGGPLTISFSVANGLGSVNYFSDDTNYTVYLSNSAGLNFAPIHTFNSGAFPPSVNSASAVVTRIVPIPAGTLPGTGYKIAVSASLPTSLGAIGGNASQPFTLFDAFTIPANLNGFIKCSSPAINYYVLTITNTGNLTDAYNLSKVQSLYPLGSEFYALSGSVISSTPSIDPGESYTFMMRFDTPNGTPPDNWNTTIVTATSVNNPTVSHTTNISTYIYCGNMPNMPDSPDMEIVKTTTTATASVGDYIDYVITMKNNSPKNASSPAIKDYLPANAQLISYNKRPGETRNVVFSYNSGNNTLTAVLQSNMTNASLPLTIHVKVKTYCQSVPMVTNSAEVFTVSGDHNSDNDISSVSTSVSYNLLNTDVGRWTGAFSSDWFDCRNWSGGVIPNNNVDVIIPESTPNSEISALSPLAPADKIARTHHLAVVINGSLTMVNSGLLNIAGNWNSNGNFSAGNGHVKFMGSVNNAYQYISDSTEQTEFYNLTIDTPNSAKGLSVPDGFGIFVNNDLALTNGDLRLNGKSQLIQTKTGANSNPAGNGKVYIDQQGKSNMYSYNYWSSPVGTNNTYTVNEVLRDGTDPSNPQDINWVSGVNGSATSPISLAYFWLRKYQNQTGSYANWSTIGQNGLLSAGQGYTMKGSGAATPLQNYTFAGKPNNGNVTSMVSPNNMNLSGNPYPCALDAYAFIDDNAATITGTLYFWEQFSTNSTHITANYEGGYATMTKTGATPPAAPVGISSAGFSTRIPHRYIPVGQGFLLFGSASGGQITYGNNQRAFVKETDSNSNPMFKAGAPAPAISAPKKLRVGFRVGASSTRQRQILLGFMNNAATDSFDNGYDALQVDTYDTDMYFILEDKNLVIQGRGFYNDNVSVPVGVRLAVSDVATFNLDSAENFGNSDIFLYDAFTNVFHDLRNGPVSIALPQGIYDSRFSIRFSNSVQTNRNNGGQISMIYSNRTIQIENSTDNSVTSVKLYNTIGQEVQSWNVEQVGEAIVLPVNDIAIGTYIARIQHGNQYIAKKIIIQ